MAAKPLKTRFPQSWFATTVSALLFATAAGNCQQPGGTPVEIGLDQAASRNPVSYTPTRLNEKVIIHAAASSTVFQFPGYRWLPVQDQAGNGIFLEDSGTLLDAIVPGDDVEATGIIGIRAGMPVVIVESVRKRGSIPIAEPRKVFLGGLDGFRWLGTLVSTEGIVRGTGIGSFGSYIDLEEQGHRLRVFHPAGKGGLGEWEFFKGDRIRVSGYASQYCPNPPHNRFFHLLLDSPSKVIVLDSAWIISPYVALGILGLFAAALMVWIWFAHRWASQRKVIRGLNAISEDILSCKSQADVLRKLREALPKSMKVSGVRMYLHNRATNNLDRLGSVAEPEIISASVDAEADSPFAGAALAFRSRTLLTIPAANRSPVFTPQAAEKVANSLVYIPMIASGDIAGVIELVYQKTYRRLSNDEQICAQHLGNQVAAAFKLMHQQSIQDQLLRSEKLAAAGQLISGIAGELKDPLASIESVAKNLLRRQMDSLTERDLRSISNQALQASEIVSRLIGFSRADKGSAAEVSLNALLKGLLQFREQEFLLRGIKLDQSFTRDEIILTGNQGQLEQVFLNLLLYAEKQQTAAANKQIKVSSNPGGKKAVVSIAFSTIALDNPEDPLETDEMSDQHAKGLGFARGIFNAHGGAVRFARNTPTEARFEVELPIAARPATQVPETKPMSKARTILVVEPDGNVLRKLLSVLSMRGHRVVPVNSAEEAIDLLERLPFDLAFCSVRLPGKSWVDFYDAVRHRMACFVLVTEGIDDGLSRIFEGSEGHLLRKPIDDADLDQLLQLIEHGPVASQLLESVPAEPVGRA